MPRPILATIHTAALQHNLARARLAAQDAKLWCVVKANAYGHGIEQVFDGMRAADGFALLEPSEAQRIRELGWTGPILLLEGFFEKRDLDLVIEYGLTPAVHCNEQLAMLEALRPAAPIPIYLKMNSGMNRVGYKPALYRAAWERARACQAIGSIAVVTHFAEADTAV